MYQYHTPEHNFEKTYVFLFYKTIHELINDKSWREMCRIWRMYIYIYI